MSNADLQKASLSGSSTPLTSAPNYGSTIPVTQQTDLDRPRFTRCPTGGRFLSSVHGILDIIIILSLICAIIAASLVSGNSCKAVDDYGYPLRGQVNAYNTRASVIAFASLGLILILVDIGLHVSGAIEKMPASFDLGFIFVMLLFGVIYLILGCCAAAWETKMDNAIKVKYVYEYQGAAAVASFFLFVATLVVFIDFTLRCRRLTGRAD